MTVKTPAQLQAQYDADIPDNVNGDIDAADVRVALKDTTDSWDAQKADNTQDVVARWNADALQGKEIDATAPVDKQILVFNASTDKWEPKDTFESFGMLHLINNATATTISTVDTPVLVAGTFNVSTQLSDFTQANGRLTYTDTPTKTFKATISVSFSATSNDRAISALVALNGTVIAESKSSNTTTALEASETTSFILQDLSTNDFLEVFIENNENTSDITASQVHFLVETF